MKRVLLLSVFGSMLLGASALVPSGSALAESEQCRRSDSQTLCCRRPDLWMMQDRKWWKDACLKASGVARVAGTVQNPDDVDDPEDPDDTDDSGKHPNNGHGNDPDGNDSSNPGN